MCLVC